MERKSAYIVGTGLAALTAACYLVRDGQMPGRHIHIFEKDPIPGGACDGWEYPGLGYVMRGGREMDNHFEVMWDLFRSIPSIETPEQTVLDEYYYLNKRDPNYSLCRATVDRGQDARTDGKFGLSDQGAMEIMRLFFTPDEELYDRPITDFFSDEVLSSNFWLYWRTMFAFENWHSALEMKLYIRRYIHHIGGLPDFSALRFTRYNQYESMILPMAAYLEERGIDGLIVTAPDTVAMSEEIDRLVAAGIPVVTCDSDVRQSRRLYHIGQDMVKSGRVAAGLLAPYVEGADVLVVTGNREFTAHGMRVRGFLDRMHEIFGVNMNAHVIESVERYELTYDGVLQQVRQNPRLRGIYMANESVRGCMDALERAKPARRIHVVCHDLTPHAKQYLEEGRVDFIIDQDFSAQTTRAIEVLAHTLRTGEPPRQSIEYIHTSIITRELL